MPDTDANRPDLLWHYTTTESLIKILQTKQIWATDAQYLNDSRELIQGADQLIDEANFERADPPTTTSEVRRLWMEIHQSLGEGARVSLPAEGPFVACFCGEEDLLSQWRGYASGSGYAIGFSRAALQAAALAAGGSLVQAIYDLPQPGDASLFHASALTVGETGPRLVPTPTALAKYKHPAFHEEREWRIVVPSSSDSPASPRMKVNFRAGAQGLVPYIEAGFEEDAVVEVMVGPGDNQERRRLAVERLLASAKIPATTSKSAAPYRG